MWVQFDQFITARVHSTREGIVFTGVCLSTSRGGGYLPSQVWMGGGVPTFSGGGEVPNFPGLDGEVPTFPGLDGGGGGTYFPRSGQRGTYLR